MEAAWETASLARELPEIERRSSLRAAAAIGAVVRATLLEAGIDPAAVAAMRRVEAAESELAALPDSDALRIADSAVFARRSGGENADALQRFATQISKLAARCRAEAPPDPAQASPAMWFAWSLAYWEQRHALGALRPDIAPDGVAAP
jgi:hypothetical protein